MQDTRTKTRSLRAYREGKRRLRSVRWMLFWIAFFQVGVTAILAVVASFFSTPPHFLLQMFLIEMVAYLFPLSLYAGSHRILTAKAAQEQFSLRPVAKPFWPWLILGGIGCQFVMLLLNLPVNLLLSEGEAIVPATVPELLLSLLVVAAIPSLFEEFLFRGVVYGVMQEFNSRAAAIFTTVLFALMHGSLTGFLGYVFLGWASVEILRRTGSVYACMLFHFVNNTAALCLSHFSSQLLYFPAATIWIFLLGLFLAGLSFWKLYQKPPLLPSTKQMKAKDLLGQSFLSLPTILCILAVLAAWTLQ